MVVWSNSQFAKRRKDAALNSIHRYTTAPSFIYANLVNFEVYLKVPVSQDKMVKV